MKAKFTLLVIVSMAFLFGSAQQVPNQYFNTWTSNLNPDGWGTLSELLQSQEGEATEDASNKVIGNASLELSTVYISAIQQNSAGLVSVGTIGLNQAQTNVVFSGIAFKYRPDTLTVLSEYTSTSTDSGAFYLDLTSDTAGVLLALEGVLPYGSNATTWSSTSYALTDIYHSNAIPDTLVLQFVSSPSGTPPVGSVLHINGVYFGYVDLPTGLKEELNSLNLSVYPNPASEVLNISSAQDMSGYSLLMYDMNGKLVSGQILSDKKTSVGLSAFASGTYIYKIADRTGNILTQNKFVVAK